MKTLIVSITLILYCLGRALVWGFSCNCTSDAEIAFTISMIHTSPLFIIGLILGIFSLGRLSK